MKPHLVFLYLGRRGISRLALNLARCVADISEVKATFCISRQNELFSEFAQLRPMVLGVDTFTRGIGAAGRLYRIPFICRELVRTVAVERSVAVVNLMPHVWTPLIAPVIRARGCKYVTIVHDAVPHPGDPTSFVRNWTSREARNADVVITLSRAVSDTLLARTRIAHQKVVTLFHPDLEFGYASPRQRPSSPFRVLFFGRILPYKGLSILVEALELLRRGGLQVELGVYGEGDLSLIRNRLTALGSEVVNRWIGDGEVGSVLSRFDAVVVSHSEASQSGVAAAALGSGLPVIASPVGGLVEQIVDGENGVLARTPDASGLAEAIRRLASDTNLYETARKRILETHPERSMGRFAEDVCTAACTGSRRRSVRSGSQGVPGVGRHAG